MPVAFVRAPCGESGNSVPRLLEVDPRRCFSDWNGRQFVCAVDLFSSLQFSRLRPAHFRMLLLGIYDVGLLDASSPYSTKFLIHLFNSFVGSHSFWNGSDHPKMGTPSRLLHLYLNQELPFWSRLPRADWLRRCAADTDHGSRLSGYRWLIGRMALRLVAYEGSARTLHGQQS